MHGLTRGAGLIPCLYSTVGIPVDAHHRKNATLVYSNLVVARYAKSRRSRHKKGGYFYLFCDFPRHNMTDYEMIEKALQSYRLRWKIEEVHRHVKNCYAWEDMQVMTFDRLNNLNCLLLLAVSYLYSLEEYLLALGVQFSYLVFDKKKFSKLPKFIYYRLSLVIRELFRDWRFRPRHKFKAKYVQREVMSWY